MRTFRKTIFAGLFFTMLFSGVYGTVPYIKVRSYDAKKFMIIVKHQEPSQVKVVLKDKNSQQLYSETYSNPTDYLKGFNVESLPNGQYILDVENESRLERFYLSIQNNKLTIDTATKLVVNRPDISQEGNKVEVALLKETSKPMKLSIFNQTNDMIYEDTVEASGRLVKSYDMSRLLPGAYIMKIDIAGRNFSQYIRIQ